MNNSEANPETLKQPLYKLKELQWISKAGIFFFLLDKEFPLSRNDGKNITLAHESSDFKRNG